MLRAIFIILLLLGSGCAVFDDNQIPDIVLPAKTIANDQKPSVSFKSLAMSGLTKRKAYPEKTQTKLAKELQSVLEDSNYFSNVSADNPSADISISAEVIDHGNQAAMIPAIITGFSGYTIPSWATNNFDITATVQKPGQDNKEYNAIDSAKLVQWLPMAFLFPVKNFSVVPEIRKNMYRKILSEMDKDGMLD